MNSRYESIIEDRSSDNQILGIQEALFEALGLKNVIDTLIYGEGDFTTEEAHFIMDKWLHVNDGKWSFYESGNVKSGSLDQLKGQIESRKKFLIDEYDKRTKELSIGRFDVALGSKNYA